MRSAASAGHMERKKQKLDAEADKSKSKMRIMCDVCEKAEATIICSADEAALCMECDVEVHQANMVAIKHQRVPLIKPIAKSPLCDVCQEKTGYFFCMEDRALLCRNCDLSIHTVNTILSNHQRFLVTGARVALTALETPGSPRPASGALLCPSRKANDKTHGKFSGFCKKNLSDYTQPKITGLEKPDKTNASLGVQSRIGNASKKSTSDLFSETIPEWRVDELLNFPDLPTCFDFCDIHSSGKDDMVNLEDSDWAAEACLADEDISGSGPHEVPKMPSPPTVSGLSRSRKVPGPGKSQSNDGIFNCGELNTLIVPDLDITSNPELPYF